MSCQPFNFVPGGGQGFICGGPRTRRCTVPECTAPATALCDEPLVGVPGKRTCSRPMCEQHRTRTTTGIDICPPHASAREGAAAAPQPGHLRLVSHTILGCFCAPQVCHGDVIAAWVDAQPVAP